MRQYAVAYAPSASVLRPDLLYHARQQAPPSKTLLAMAPFGGTASWLAPLTAWGKGLLGLPRALEATVRALSNDPLPASRHEVLALSQLFHPDATVLVDTQATKDVLQTHGQAYRYVHFATHGFVDAMHPMYSGLLLADQMLQTYEIFNLTLQADLVTLSACETGLGALRHGGGLVGLTRAFMFAGTPSVLASVWRVDDTSTAKLMTDFYRQIKAGIPKGIALQRAKLAIMQQYPHPHFWAPFVLSGAWRYRAEISSALLVG